jgi:dolichyl-phosphate-mannose-protein mannosyltransferase
MDTEAAGTSAIRISFTIPASPIAVILALGLLVRLIAAALPGFGIDLGTFQFWSMRLGDQGSWNFYSDDFFSDWSPGYLYVLWFFGGLDSVFDFNGDQFWYVLKTPSIAVDLASAYLLYRILGEHKEAIRVGAAALYLLHPVVLLVGPVWGQVDSILAFFLLLTVYYLAQGRTSAAAVVYTIGFLVKPQAVAALPVFAFWGLRDEVRQVLAAPEAADPLTRPIAFGRDLAARVWPVVVASLVAAFFMILPFFPSNPFGIFGQLKDATEVYPYNSFYAYNFWGLTDWLKPDDLTFWGLAYRWWGIVLFVAASLSIIWTFRNANSPGLLALATALSVLAFYLFMTRMHERYLFPSILLLLTAAAALKARPLWAMFAVLSLVQFFNVYYAYILFTEDNYLRVDWLFDWIDDRVFLLSLLAFLTFPVLLIAGGFLAMRDKMVGEGGKG